MALAGILMLLPAGPSLGAQQNDPLVLVSGPVRRHGIEVLAPNPLEHFVASYERNGGAVTVYFLPAPLRRPEVWVEVGCGTVTLFRSGSDGAAFHYLEAPDEAFALLIASGAEDPCALSQQFLREFTFFRTVSYGDPIPQFPALIPVR